MWSKNTKVKSPWEQASQDTQQVQCGQPERKRVEKPSRNSWSESTQRSAPAVAPKIWHEGAD
jgi:hypothetical protein